MTSCLEFDGKNVEKAVEKACKELNISKEKLKYDVISYGSTGIFGLVGTKKAKIRVALPEPAPGISPETISAEELKEQGIEEERSQIQAIVEGSEIYDFPDNPSDLGRDVLQRMVDFITTDAKISVEEDSDRIFFNVKGGNSAVLIGKRGQTLEAIQYIVEKIINKRNEQRVRIQIDIEGYMENRRARLQGLSKRLADKAKRIGKPVTMGQMNAHDRRIVHLALKDDKGIRTQSKGNGFYRKLVIFPRKNTSKKKNTS